jgi:hypothetical protein
MTGHGGVTISRGFGDLELVIPSCRTVEALIKEVGKETSWLWGVGNAFNLIQMYENRSLTNDDTFSANHTHWILLQYLPLKSTKAGFPCFRCMKWVFWDGTWWVRYVCPRARVVLERMRLFPKLQGVSELFYRPKEYLCYLCGQVKLDHEVESELIIFDPSQRIFITMHQKHWQFYRVSKAGFPCWKCQYFVFWNSSWFVRYTSPEAQ